MIDRNNIKMVAGYTTQRANVNTFQQWLEYGVGEAVLSRTEYFNAKL